MFQNIVITIAIIILIITLAFIGISLYRQKSKAKYPPVIPNCPDYWETKGNFCVNSMDLGNNNAGCREKINFSTPQWSGQPGLCGKYKWANACNITWDGISNNKELCD
jgi:hypothetical protein